MKYGKGIKFVSSRGTIADNKIINPVAYHSSIFSIFTSILSNEFVVSIRANKFYSGQRFRIPFLVVITNNGSNMTLTIIFPSIFLLF